MLIGALVVLAIFSYPVWRPLLGRATVQVERFPGLSDAAVPTFQALPNDQKAALQTLLKANPTQAVELAQAAVNPDTLVPQEQQATPQMTDPTTVARGIFTKIDTLHWAEGDVALYQLPDNTRILRFENFRSSKGPTLHVILTRAAKPRDPTEPDKPNEVGTDYIDLGELKGNVGGQNYSVPPEVDLATYQGVVIYSMRLNSVFSSAALQPV
jgi:hypothetical protein